MVIRTVMSNKDQQLEGDLEKVNDILKNKFYLYLTEFFSGMAVMAVELGASRLLAPYFSSSQIVWTIIIGTIMIAMALGNLYGGWSADKNPDPDRLYGRMMIAGVWIAAIPVFGKYLILGISGLVIITVNQNFLIIAAFLACMLIFVYPLFLLGTVTPSLVKYTVSSLDDSGKTVGTLGAFNTIGSILGTFLPTFVTIPAVGTSITFLIFSGILLLLGLVYFLSRKTGRRKCVAFLAVFLVCSFLGNSDSFAFWEKNLTYEGESVYNYLQVKEDSQNVILSTNVLFGVQSITKKDNSLTGMYYDYAMAAPVMAGIDNKKNADMLILGMGTGTYARECLRYFGNMKTEGVEIDQKITDLAQKYFDEPKNAKVTTYDGRAYLQASDQKYDVIMVDAYQDITIPFQMSTVEFFNMVKEHLKAGGVMVVNMNMRSEEKGNINQYLADTIARVFPEVYTVDVQGYTNRELFAMSGDEKDQGIKQFKKYQSELPDGKMKELMASIGDQMSLYTGGGDILTDDKAPVELLGMHEIDGLIQNEAGYYKGLYHQKGMRGLLKDLGISI